MRSFLIAVLLASSFAALPLPGAAVHAQRLSPSYAFLEAVKKRDGDKATALINTPGNYVINSRSGDDGKTALHIVVERRDATWLRFLLSKGADTNIGDDNGNTPLMLATQLSTIDALELLIANGAKVNGTNRSGETPLIRAVQLRDLEAVRVLLKNGANPDIRDNVSGRSAREYAALDGRSSAVLGLIEGRGAPQKTPTTAGGLDFSGIK